LRFNVFDKLSNSGTFGDLKMFSQKVTKSVEKSVDGHHNCKEKSYLVIAGQAIGVAKVHYQYLGNALQNYCGAVPNVDRSYLE
jgi:hypothetical protein